ncbi:MAG TPA: hypothetical protein VM598_05590, partial [Bdellovibrionota bacterium]|nr:hypothetical protein [Bdellovibrionota bacterium]
MTPDGTASESLGSRIREAWELRFNQRIDEARSRLHALRNEAGLPPLLGPELPDLSAEAVELALLSASLLRAEGQLERSRELVEACERQVTSRGLPMPFQLPVQKALGLTLQGDWSRALELYLTALHRASSDWERCSALLNSLL